MPLLSYGGLEQADNLSGSDMSLEKSGDSTILGREFLLFQEVPVVVVTPSKVAQPILESPSSITVLTKQDIERYGINSFTDILRNVPGVDVMSVSPTDRNVSIRSFNQLAAGRILSLVDGRPIYLDFYGLTVWSLLPVSIEDIERIEIVRGPGSALYGANAFDGVVNIITSSAGETGTRMTAKSNQYGNIGGSITHGGRVGDMSYTTSLASDAISGWDDADKDAGENRFASGSLKYYMDDKSSFCISGDTHEFRGDIIASSEIEPAEHSGRTSYLRMGYDRQDLKCRILWRRLDSNAESKGMLSYHSEENTDGTERKSESCLKCHDSVDNTDSSELPSYGIESNTVDIELQHSFCPLSRNFITWGLNYRFNQMDSELVRGEHYQNLLAGYIQNQLRLSESLDITAGLRYDRHPLTGNNFSPRGSVVYSPAVGHAFRVSAGRAFRNPSFVYSYLHTHYQKSFSVFPTPFYVTLIGNTELSPEWITSLEFGYRGKIGNRLKLNVDTFFNRLHGLTEIVYLESYHENALFPGSPGGIIPSLASIANVRDAEARGGEIAMDLTITRWLTAQANYSYQHVTDLETGVEIESAPRHKVNPGLYAKLGKSMRVSLFANYVDRTVWDGVEINSYTLLNSMISYKMGNTDIALSAFNVLNNRHQEHPQGDEVGRSVVLSLTHQIW